MAQSEGEVASHEASVGALLFLRSMGLNVKGRGKWSVITSGTKPQDWPRRLEPVASCDVSGAGQQLLVHRWWLRFGATVHEMGLPSRARGAIPVVSRAWIRNDLLACTPGARSTCLECVQRLYGPYNCIGRCTVTRIDRFTSASRWSLIAQPRRPPVDSRWTDAFGRVSTRLYEETCRTWFDQGKRHHAGPGGTTRHDRSRSRNA